MVIKKYISENLNHLDQAYRRESDPKKATYYSKLAILELCGWIEVSMDKIILSHGRKKVKFPKNTKFIETNVKQTYGFEYEKHFRKMLISLIGIVDCENIESRVNSTVKTHLEVQLKNLKLIRDNLAHTYLQGSPGQSTIDAPSTTKARLDDIYKGLKEFQKTLREL
ncbi:hypothetical protein WJT86_05690 [Microvirga sp. W0021]|uniref:RiboL-PSP-HEPN domain-containing protein n=1 Tax=Hohaiivirga grylli TaxID=3133970 RepID=A0ABV0BHW6_9HYPH